MAAKTEIEITDEEIDALVAEVSSEIGPLPEDDDIDVDDIDFNTKDKTELPNDATGEEMQTGKAESTNKIVTDPQKTVELSTGNQNESAKNVSASEKLHSTAQIRESKEDNSSTEPESAILLEANKVSACSPIVHTKTEDQKEVSVVNSGVDSASDDSRTAGVQTDVQKRPAQQKSESTCTSSSDNAKSKGAGKVKQEAEKSPTEVSPSNTTNSGGGWSWLGGWGSAIVSSATAVSSHVGEGFYHVLEKVEASLVEPEDEHTTEHHGKSEERPTVEEKRSIASPVRKSPGIAVGTNIVAAEKEASNKVSDVEKADRENLHLDLPSGTEPKLSSGEEIPICTPSSEVGTDNLQQNEERITGAKKKRNVARKKKDEFAGGGYEEHAGEQLTPGEDDQAGGGWFTGWNFSPVAQLAGAVTKTGKKVVSTGISAIGDIGKKTYHAFMEEEEESDSTAEFDGRKKLPGSRKKQPSFSVALDDGSGEAHLEALKELSQWSAGLLEQQLLSIAKVNIDVVREDVAMIREAFNLGGVDDLIESLSSGEDRDHNFVQLIGDFVSQLGLNLNICRLMAIQQCTRDYMNELTSPVSEPKDVHQRAVKSLVELTAVAVALYHKVGQLILVEGGIPLLAYKFRALSLAGLTKVLCMEIYIESNRFTSALLELASSLEDETTKSAVTSLSTMIELEASNCSCTLQDACAFLLPIMQLVVVRVHPQLADSTGFAQLEALQMLSSMSRTNVREFVAKLPDSARTSIEAELTAVEAAFDLGFFQHDEDVECSGEEFLHRFEELVKLLAGSEEVGVDKFIATQKQARMYTSHGQTGSLLQSTTQKLHQVAIKSLTDLTADAVSLFYSLAQLTLTEKPHRTKLYAQKAENLARLTKLTCVEIGALSTKFSDNLSASASGDAEAVTPFVTNIYLEASSCCTYIQDAFHLMLPVYQLTLVKAHSWFSDKPSDTA